MCKGEGWNRVVGGCVDGRVGIGLVGGCLEGGGAMGLTVLSDEYMQGMSDRLGWV